MATDVSLATLRGLLIPDPRLTYARAYSAQSVLTQQGPIPGVPVDQGESEMVLESGGSMGADLTLDITARTGGHPRPDGATFAWRYSTDAASERRGWDPPQAVSGFEALEYTTTANRWREFNVIRRIDDGIVTTALKSQRYIRVWTKPYSSSVWTEQAVYDTGATVTYTASPCITQLPNGRLLLFHWQEISASENQIRMHYSDDGGVTWTLGQQNCLLTPLDTTIYQPNKLRCGYLNGEILLVADVRDSSGAQSRDRLVQYASDDLGASFTQVSITAGYSAVGDGQSRYIPEVTVVQGRFLVTYLKRRVSAYALHVPHRKFLGQAFEDLSSAEEDIAVQNGNLMEWGTNSATRFFTAGELSTWLDEDGVLWMAGSDFSQNNAGYAQRSVDNGLNWAMIGSGSGTGYGAAWYRGRDGSTYPRDFSACSHLGRVCLIHRFAANPGTADDSICALYLGGYTTVTLPNLTGEAPSVKHRVGWEYSWLPYDEPDNLGGLWVRVVGGAPAISLNAGSLLYTGGAGDSVSYTMAVPPGTVPEGIIAMVDGLCATSSAGGGNFITLRVGGLTSHYIVRVVYSEQKIVLRDMVAGADIATLTDQAATDAGRDGCQILLFVNNPTTTGNDGQVRAFYRPATVGSESDRHWVLIGSSNTLQDGGGAASEVQWGVLNGVATTSRTRIQVFSSDSYAGDGLYDFVNPNDLLGRTFSNTLQYVDRGTRLRAVDGPAFRGDDWNITTDYRYPIRNIFPEVSPSPRQQWRSVDDKVDVAIRLDQDMVINQDTEMLGGSIGIHLREINFREVQLQAAPAGGIFATIATIFTDQGQNNLGFIRNGDELRVNVAFPGTPSDHWYTYNTLRNSYVRLTRTGEQGFSVVRKITHNSEGAWRGDTSTKNARMLLEGVVSTDPTGGATDSMQIWSKDVLFVINDMTEYVSYRLYIPAQDTYEGDFRIGGLTIGPVAWMGQRYSRGRILGHDPNNEVTTSRSGTRRVVNRGEMRRSVQVAWIEGLDTSSVTNVLPQPNYVSAHAGGLAAAAPADVPFLVAGLSEAVQGATTPVVYIPTYTRPVNGTIDTTLVNRNRALYARLVTGVQLESVLGEEWANPGEVFQVATVTLEEEI